MCIQLRNFSTHTHASYATDQCPSKIRVNEVNTAFKSKNTKKFKIQSRITLNTTVIPHQENTKIIIMSVHVYPFRETSWGTLHDYNYYYHTCAWRHCPHFTMDMNCCYLIGLSNEIVYCPIYNNKLCNTRNFCAYIMITNR